MPRRICVCELKWTRAYIESVVHSAAQHSTAQYIPYRIFCKYFEWTCVCTPSFFLRKEKIAFILYLRIRWKSTLHYPVFHYVCCFHYIRQNSFVLGWNMYHQYVIFLPVAIIAYFPLQPRYRYRKRKKEEIIIINFDYIDDTRKKVTVLISIDRISFCFTLLYFFVESIYSSLQKKNNDEKREKMRD